MSFPVYLTSEQITEKYGFNPEAYLVITDQVKEVRQDKISKLMTTMRDYLESSRQYGKLDDLFWEKYHVVPERASEELKKTPEYIAFEANRKLFNYTETAIQEMSAQGYELRWNGFKKS